MIPIPSAVRVWLAVGHTDMRRGMNSLAIQVQQALKRDPHAGDLYVFRGCQCRVNFPHLCRSKIPQFLDQPAG
jgi:transposase